jgi:hypothetical protein
LVVGWICAGNSRWLAVFTSNAEALGELAGGQVS